tara:strand:+ start:280 stop:543 length:264 start_codon:yes stop_codon:yes gene_type:complete
MPKVKGKHYKYTKKGMAKAKKAAKKAGVKVQYKSKGDEIIAGNANRRRHSFRYGGETRPMGSGPKPMLPPRPRPMPQESRIRRKPGI